MNAKRLITFCIFVLMALMQACAPAATPAAIAVEPRLPEPQPEYQQPMATSVPQAVEVPAVIPPDNQFQDYGVNPQTVTRYDHLSTFALDVDTASYSVTRRYIFDQNMLPPYDAVRVEEFINAFDQGYDAPRSAAFTLYADGTRAPQGYEEGSYVLRFGVQGYEVDELERKPSILTFVIDVSGSMARDNRLEMVKRSLRLLVDRLDYRDSVAIVVYGTSARSVLKPTNGDRHGIILDAVESLQPEGATNVEAGLRLGYRYAAQAYRDGANNRVVLCSDGVANVGSTDAGSILEFVQGYVDEGIYLTSLGFGMGNFNDELLEQLADRGNGSYAYIDDMDEARELFVENLSSTLQVIAKDAKVQVDFNTDVVETYRLVGYENRAIADQDFRDNSADAGELGAGHTATALYVVNLKPSAEGRIATVQLRWQDPDSYEVREINGNFNTWDLADRFEDGDPRYQLTVTVAQFAEILRESPYVYGISLSDLSRRADRIAMMMEEQDEQVDEFALLVRQAARLQE